MVIGDKTYRSDLIVYPDGRVADNWWRASGHRLTVADIRDLLAAKPDVMVAGTGIYGLMRIGSDVDTLLSDRNIELIALRTEDAAVKFNHLIETPKRVAGCFHLTC
jgi:hypothetical protein